MSSAESLIYTSVRSGNDAKMGRPLLRLGFEMGAHANGDALSMIFPDLEGNTGQPTYLQNGPFFLLGNRG